MAAENTPTLVQLAEHILEQARKLESSISSSPSFQDDTLAELPEVLEPVRSSLIEGTETLNALARGSVAVYWGRIHHKIFTFVSFAFAHWLNRLAERRLITLVSRPSSFTSSPPLPSPPTCSTQWKHQLHGSRC